MSSAVGMMTVNTYEAIRLTLLSSATIRDAVGDRVYAAYLDEVQPSQFPCITYKVGGGFTDSDAPAVSSFSVAIWVWVKTNNTDAYVLYGEVLDLLNRQLVQQVGVRLQFKETRRPLEVIEPTTRALGVVGRFTILGVAVTA